MAIAEVDAYSDSGLPLQTQCPLDPNAPTGHRPTPTGRAGAEDHHHAGAGYGGAASAPGARSAATRFTTRSIARSSSRRLTWARCTAKTPKPMET